jgi:hypothetical protein
MVPPRRENGVDMIVSFGPDYRTTFTGLVFAADQSRSMDKLLGSDIRSLVPPASAPTG